MTFEEGRDQMDDLEMIQSELRQQTLQSATLVYREAIRRDAVSGGYIQGFEVAAPEPTQAFRMDSKRPFMADSNELTRQRLYVHMQKNADPEVFASHIWTQFVLENGKAGMFEVSRNYAGVFVPEIDPEASYPIGDNSGEISIIDMLAAGIKQHSVAVRGMRAINRAMRHDFELVPFYS